MKNTVAATLFASCSIAAALFAATPPAGVATLYGDWSGVQNLNQNSAVWAETRGGTPGPWTQDSYGVVTAVRSAGDSFSLSGFRFWGLCFEHSSNYDARWNTSAGATEVGAGGIEFTTNGAISFGGTTGARSLWLTASQTWKGPDSSSVPAFFSIGHDNYQTFFMASATSTVACANLTISGNLSTWFTWTNYFGETEIRVESPARIWLEKEWNNGAARTGAPQLNARKLTLSGDGTMWNAGGASPINNARGRKPVLEAEMDAATAAGTLALENGADIAGSGAGWNIPALEVSGTGESAFTGDWTFRRARTAVSIGGGATLALSGACAEAEGVHAGFDVTGAGTLKIDKSTYGLSGAISLGAGVTLEVAGEGLPGVPVTGSGRIVISGAASGVAPVFCNRLAGFSGTVEVKSGSVIFESLPSGVTVETSGTGAVLTEDSLPTYYGDFSGSAAVWRNAAGGTATPTGYANAAITNAGTQTCQSYGSFTFRGLKVCTSRKNNFWIPRADFSLGSGGIEFETVCDLPFGNTVCATQLTLLADQEWKGPDSGDGYATLQIGFPGYAKFGYNRSVLGTGDGIGSLKVSGRLVAYFSATNDLGGVDVEIASPAKLVLCDEWTTSSTSVRGDAHLGARSITLSGDGDGHLPLGAAGVYYPYGASALSTVATLDAAYVAGALTLKDGADLTASSPVRFDLPGFSASGAGTNALSGAFEFARPSVAVTVSDGATVDFAGTFSETHPGTTLSATGSGTVVVRNGYGLSGGISLGTDVALKVVDRDVFLQPVTGGKSMEISAAGGLLFVPAQTLAGFAGDTITVTAGTAVFESVPAGVSLVEAGGTARRASDPTDGTWLVTDAPRPEARIVVGDGDTLTVCGCGLTEDTVLELAGGRVEFVRTTTITSSVICTASSSIGALSGVVGTVAGYIVASNENAGVVRKLSLSGQGTVDLSGGGAFDRTVLSVSEGSANLTGGRTEVSRANCGIFDKGQYFGIRGSATLECLRPETGSYRLYCTPGVAGYEGTLEIATGGVVRLNHNFGMYIGRRDDSVDVPGTLRVSGGTLTVSRGYSTMLGNQAGGRGRIEMFDGVFETDQNIGVADGAQGYFDWYGGTVKVGGEFRTWAGNSCKTALSGASSNLAVRLLGPGCRLDLNGAAVFTNVVASAFNAGSWTASEGACLTMANGGTCVLNRFADGCAAGVDGCSVLIDDADSPRLGGAVFRGAGADVVAVSPATGRDVDVTVATGAKWGPGQLEGVSMRNIIFEDGATLRLTLAPDGAIAPLEVEGTATCGGTLGIDFARTGRLPGSGRWTLLSASGGLTAPTAFFGVPPSTGGAAFAAEGDEIAAYVKRSGTAVIVR